MSRRTVAKYHREPRVRHNGARPPRPSKLAPSCGYLHEQVAHGVLNANA